VRSEVQVLPGPPSLLASSAGGDIRRLGFSRHQARWPVGLAELRSVGEPSFETLGAVAQLGEHLLCKQGVVGSIPSGSTNLVDVVHSRMKICGLALAGPPVLFDIVKRR
jgi:hypothetical protein